MMQKQQIQTTQNIHEGTSKLERFVLDFEYDKTLQQVKRETRIRTLD